MKVQTPHCSFFKKKKTAKQTNKTKNKKKKKNYKKTKQKKKNQQLFPFSIYNTLHSYLSLFPLLSPLPFSPFLGMKKKEKKKRKKIKFQQGKWIVPPIPPPLEHVASTQPCVLQTWFLRMTYLINCWNSVVAAFVQAPLRYSS